MFTPLKNRKIARTKSINKKVVNTKKQKRKVGGVVVGVNKEKDLEDLKNLLYKVYPEKGKHISLKTIEKLDLKNINDLMSLDTDKIDEYVETFDIEDSYYKYRIKDILIYLSRKLNAELTNLKNKLNKKFTEDITNKIITNLGISDVNDLINSQEAHIRWWQAEEGTTSETYFTKNQIDSLILLQEELKNRQTMLKARLTIMFSSKTISNQIIRFLKLTNVYELSGLNMDDMIKLTTIELNNRTHPDIKARIHHLPEDTKKGTIELQDILRIFSGNIKKIIRELALFNISDLMYATVIDIDNLNLNIEEKKLLLKLRLDEFKKFLFKKMFKDETNKVEKYKIINKIISKLGDVYELMDASDDLIMEIDPSPLSKKLNDELIKLRDNQAKLLKPNSSNSNSNSNSAITR